MLRRSQTILRFKTDDTGAVALIFGLSFIGFMLAIGVAVDASRAFSVKSKVQAAADTAALAGALLLSDGEFDDETRDEMVKARASAYFETQIEHLGTQATFSNFSATPDLQASTVQVLVDVNLKFMFGGISGSPESANFTIAATSTFNPRNIEVSLVLDVTGSMNGNGKLDAMKTAAISAVDELLSHAKTRTDVRIALAPFGASVNLGSYASIVTGGGGSDNCVIERTGSDAATDAGPDGGRAPNTMTSPAFAYYSCGASEFMPLAGRNNRDQILDRINGYVAEGNTAGHIGLAWGWYALSPRWRSIFTDLNRPHWYNPARNSKNVVMMSDGIFNTSYVDGVSNDFSVMSESSYDQFQALCTAMKARDIRVYTVAFDIDNAAARDQMAACATEDAAFTAETSEDLIAVFQNIAEDISALRVSE